MNHELALGGRPLSIELDSEVERAVRDRAAAAGVSVNELLAQTFMAGSSGNEAERRVRAMLAEWQRDDATPPTEPVTTEALFEQWREADAAMTDDERGAEDRLWEDVERGLNETRALLGMRRLSG